MRRMTRAPRNKKVRSTFSSELRYVYTLDEIKAEVRLGKVIQNYLKGRSGAAYSTLSLKTLYGLCLAQPKEQKWLMKFRKAGLSRLNAFLQNSTRKEAQSKNVKLLTWSCLSLLSFFYTKTQSQQDDCGCFRMRYFDRAKAVFRGTMYLLLPEKQDEVIKQTVRYMTLTEQWNTEDYDLFVFQELLTTIKKPELIIAKIIKQVEISQRDLAITESYNISSTLSTLLETVYWDKYLFNNLLHNCYNTLLKLYLLSTNPVPSHSTIDNAKFRVVIRCCIKNFVSNIKDNKGLVSVMDSSAKCLQDRTIGTEDRLEIAEVVAFCAQKHVCKNLRESITPDFLNLLLENLESTDKSIVNVAHKTIHQIVDRHGNIKYFTEPVYFFKGRADFTINYDFGIEDTHFFKSFSSNFFQCIESSFKMFKHKYDLVTCYTTLCLVLVELPEPVITINMIHTIITIQSDTIKSMCDLSTKAHVHAIVAAVLSLICVIHKEEVRALEKYVDEVVGFRTENSPHLLPPLQNQYNFASHHTTEYHDQLYFLEDEVLFALQRCWLTRRVARPK